MKAVSVVEKYKKANSTWTTIGVTYLVCSCQREGFVAVGSLRVDKEGSAEMLCGDANSKSTRRTNLNELYSSPRKRIPVTPTYLSTATFACTRAS